MRVSTSWLSRNLLWVDGGAGLIAGLFMLGFGPFLASFYGLPESTLWGMGAANLVYSGYSLSLASRQTRPLRWIILLAVANGSWAVYCVSLLVRFWGVASGFGLAQLAFEAVFVGGLAAVEWRYRQVLVTRTER